MKIRNASTVLSIALAAAMAVGNVPITAFAVTGSQVAADGTKTASAVAETDSEEDWSSYDVSVSLTVADGNISAITVTPGTGYSEGDDKSYLERATTRSNGIVTKLVGQSATADTINGWDTVSGATHVSEAIKSAALDAIGQFDEAAAVDKSALQSAVDAAAALTQGNYTDDSWSAFTSALTSAQSVLDNADATQEEVDSAVSSLTSAQNSLEEKAAVDKAALKTAIDAASSLSEENYTTDSWSAFKTALDAAQAAYDNADATQDEVDSAVTALTDAQAQLQEKEAEDIYVLMNIPYSEFYNLVGAGSVDVTSAATTKVRISDRAGTSYNGGGSVEASDTSKGVQSKGISFPVKVSDELLKDSKYTEVTDDTTYHVSYIAHGQTVSADLNGQKALIQADDYAYYKLDSTPSNYLELTSDGFSAVQGDTTTVENAAEVVYGSRWGTYEVDLTVPTGNDAAGAVVVKTDKLTFGLKPTQHFWQSHELAWTPTDGLEETNGATLESITVYTTEGVYVYPVNQKLEKKLYSGSITAGLVKNSGSVSGLPDDIADAKVTVSYTEGSGRSAKTTEYVEDAQIENGTFAIPEDAGLEDGKEYTVSVSSSNYVDVTTSAVYSSNTVVLMNIPYADFYKAIGADGVDVTSSATAKLRNKGLAGSTYNGGGNATNTDSVTDQAKGVQFAVKVDDDSLLSDAKYTEVTDDISYEIAYYARGQLAQSTLKGKDALIQSGDYAYAALSELPANYLELTSEGLSGIKGSETKAVDGSGIDIVYGGRYGTYQVNFPDEVTGSVSAVIIKTDKQTFRLEPTDHIWRSMEVAWTPEGDLADSNGATLESLTVYTADKGVYEITVNQKLKNASTGSVTAELSKSAGKVTGLPSDIADAKVTVSYTTGSGRTAVTTKVIEDAALGSDGSFTVPDGTNIEGREYTVTVSSSNYVDIKATAVPDGWVKKDDGWYLYKNNETLKGWQKVGNTWYYLDPETGLMKTGWQKINGTWYYLKSSGAMATGWQKVNGTWYYLRSSGAMATGWEKVSGTWYYLKSSGAMATGWQKVNGTWYYLKSSGAMATGWQKVGNKWYYLRSSGAMATGWLNLNGTYYYLFGDGHMAANEWAGNLYWLSSDGRWTYKAKGSWKHNKTGWWFGDTTGWYAKNETVRINGTNYQFNASGYMK